MHIALAASALAALILLTSPEQGRADDRPDKLQILSLLEKRDFVALNRRLATLQEKSEKDIRKEVDVQLAFETFSTSRPNIESLLNEWVKAHPNSYPAQLAAAEYFAHMGWEQRGGKWAQETSKEQLEAMNSSFAQAVRHLTTALTLHPKLMEGYAVLMNMVTARGEQEREGDLLQRALAQAPGSFRVRRSHMQALLPRWGGSYEAMQNFARESQTYAAQNPKLKVLLGMVAWDMGRRAVHTKNYGLAVQLFTKALEASEYAAFYADRADAYNRMKEYDKALADTNRALELYPQNPPVLADRARALTGLDRLQEAERDVELASQLDPGEESLRGLRDWLAGKLTSQGYALQKKGIYDEAMIRFDEAVKVNPTRHETLYWRARLHFQKGNLDRAQTDLEEAIRLNPHYFEAYQTLDAVLGRSNRWDEVIAQWNRFLELEPHNANAYLERAGTFRRKRDMVAALTDLKKACDLGNGNACQIYERESGRTKASR